MESPLQILSTQAAGLLHVPAPDQHQALVRSEEAGKAWITGPSWKKNLEVAVDMCWSAALKGETSLLCVNPMLKRQIVEMLKDAGMHGLFFDLSGHADSSVLGAFQVAKKKRAATNTINQAEVALEEFLRWDKEQEQGYQNLEKVLFGELTWKDIVDQRSTVTPSTYQHFITSAVKDRFDLTHKEYWHLRGRIKSFARLRTLRTSAFEILDALNPALFEDPDASLKATLVAQLEAMINEGREVLCEVADAIHAYKQDLTTDHQSRSGDLFGRLNHIQQLLAAGETKFGQKFFDESTLTNTWQAIVKSTRPEIQILHQARNEVRQAFLDLYDTMQETNMSELDDITAFMPDPLTIESIVSACDEIHQVMQEWAIRADAHVAEHHKRINALNVSRGEDLRQMVKNAEIRIDAFIELLNSNGILKSIPEVNALSIEKKAAVIEATVRLCLRLMDASADIDAYTLWTGFWSAQNNRTKSVLRCLDMMEDSDLVQAFDTWYFGLTLSQIPDHVVPHENSEFQQQHPQITDLRAALEGHMRAIFQTQRYEVIREIGSVYKNFSQSISKSQLNVFSEELRILPAKDITRLFPVLLCTQEQVAEYGYYADRLFVITDQGHDHKGFAAQSKRCVLITESAPKFVPEGWEFTQMQILPVIQTANWREVPTADRLAYVEGIATQFSPYLDQLRVFNARGVQILSFLGDKIDAMLMERLGMPFKQVGEHGLTRQLLIECFLDRRKPIVLLLRDHKIGSDYRGFLPWHLMTIDLLKSCGIQVSNLWSVHLKNAPTEALEDLYESVRRFAEEVNVKTTASVQESSIFGRNAQSGSSETQPVPEDKRREEQFPGL